MSTKYLEISSLYRNRNRFPNASDFEIIFHSVKKDRYNSEDPISKEVPITYWNGSLQNNGFSDNIKLNIVSSTPLQTDYSTQNTNNMKFLGHKYRLEEESSSFASYNNVSFNLGVLSANSSTNKLIVTPSPHLQVKYNVSTENSATNPIKRYNRVTKFLRGSGFYSGLGIKITYTPSSGGPFYCYRKILSYEYLTDQLYPNFNYDNISNFSSSTTEKYIWSQSPFAQGWSNTNFNNNNLPQYLDAGEIILDFPLPESWGLFNDSQSLKLECEIINPSCSWGGLTSYNFDTEILQSTLQSTDDTNNIYSKGSIGSKIFIPNSPETNGEFVGKYIINETMRWLMLIKTGNSSTSIKSYFEEKCIDGTENTGTFIPQLQTSINNVNRVGNLFNKSNYYNIISSYDSTNKLATLTTKIGNNFMPRWLAFWYSTSNNAIETPDVNVTAGGDKKYNDYRNGYIQYKPEYIIEDSCWLTTDYYSVRESINMINGMRGIYNRSIPNSSWLATTSSSGLAKTTDYYEYATDSNENNNLDGNIIYLNSDEKLDNSKNYYKNSFIRFWFNGKTMGVLTAQGQQITTSTGPAYDSINWTEKGDRNNFDSVNWNPMFQCMKILKYYRKGCILKLTNPEIKSNNNTPIYNARGLYLKQTKSTKYGRDSVIYIESVKSNTDIKYKFDRQECDRGYNFTATYTLNQIGATSNYYITSELEQITFSNNDFVVTFTVKEVSEYAFVKVEDKYDLTSTVIQYSPITFENTFWEILPFHKDNQEAFNYIGDTQQQGPSCYQIELSELILPNMSIGSSNHGLIQNYPYLYVVLENTCNKGTNTVTNVLFSNNPHSHKALFRLPIDDYSNGTPYCRFGGNGMVQTIKFKPNENLHFAIYFPDGTLYKTNSTENFSPYPPKRTNQISAIFTIAKVV